MAVKFFSLAQGQGAGAHEPGCAYLYYNSWDDWFEFETTFSLNFVDSEGTLHSFGLIKIGMFDMPSGTRRPPIPATFEQLDATFYSLGQSEDYYAALAVLAEGPQILSALNDVVANPDLFERAKRERVTQVSLLRSVPAERASTKFRKILSGDATLSRFGFTYSLPVSGTLVALEPPTLKFQVEPNSFPPTNVHALIGRNGVGKTRCLHLMSCAILGTDPNAEQGVFAIDTDGGGDKFANLISVTFSAFDPFKPAKGLSDQATALGYAYVGLKSLPKQDAPPSDAQTGGKMEARTKSSAELTEEFVKSAQICRRSIKRDRWRSALTTLESDPLFEEADVTALASNEEFTDWEERAWKLFDALSSGHKIVLLTTTRLVELVDEQTLVLIDEPEGHLHPPLLSAFIRALSDLLMRRNGVAIVATHSPVVLQEVPRSCVQIMNRSGRSVSLERPQIETFGENVGTLTREVFGLEVTESGFHNLIKQRLEANAWDYESTLSEFSSELGGEARVLMKSLSVARLAS